MGSKRNERLSEDKRQALLQAAIAEFGEHGFAAANINRIAAAAQITRGLFYYYFDDRDDLQREALAVLKTAVIEAVGPFDMPTGAPEFFAVMERNQRRILHLFATDPLLMAFVRRLLQTALHEQASEPVREILTEVRQFMTAFLSLGQALGAVRQDVPQPLLIANVLAMVTTCATWALDEIKAGADPETCRKTVLAYVRCVVAARPGGPV